MVLLGLITFSLLNDNPLPSPPAHVSNIYNNVNEIKNISIENRKLKPHLEEYESLVKMKEDLKKENKELKNILKTTKDFESKDYNVIQATVISRDIEKDWYDFLVISKGKKDGIVKNMAVSTSDGLIGKIAKVGNNTSTVQLLTGNDDRTNRVSVNFKEDQNTIGVIQGYDQEEDILLLRDIEINKSVKIGNTVITSGLGNYPSGLEIGSVVDKKNDKSGITQVLHVKPSADFYSITEVLVISK